MSSRTLILIVQLLAAPALGYTVDQQSAALANDSYSGKFNDLAQSFTPEVDRLDAVELAWGCCGAPGTQTVTVHIRDGGLAGPILGSSTAVIADGATGDPFIRFWFSPPLSVVPGQPYVIDVDHVSGENGGWGGTDPDTYPGGTRFVNGSPIPGDFRFRTALLPQPVLAGPGVPVEYSNALDEQAEAGGGGHAGLDPGQVLYTEAPDGAADARPSDTFDYAPGIEDGNEPDAQVDALSNGDDALFDDLLANGADLLVSVVGDDGPAQVAAWQEEPGGAGAIRFVHVDLHASDGAVGTLDDVDGLELWGSFGIDDAYYYSHEGDAFVGGSVFSILGGSPVVYVDHAAIVAAVTSLGFTGAASDVDVDALMVKDRGTLFEFDAGDALLFSIRAAGNFDGGEIIHLRPGGVASFLVHGGHAWDTTFGVAGAFGVVTGAEDVDALEAAPLPGSVPALPAAGALALGLALAAAAAIRRPGS